MEKFYINIQKNPGNLPVELLEGKSIQGYFHYNLESSKLYFSTNHIGNEIIWERCLFVPTSFDVLEEGEWI